MAMKSEPGTAENAKKSKKEFQMLVFLLKCQDKSKKKIYNVGILDWRWQENF